MSMRRSRFRVDATFWRGATSLPRPRIACFAGSSGFCATARCIGCLRPLPWQRRNSTQARRKRRIAGRWANCGRHCAGLSRPHRALRSRTRRDRRTLPPGRTSKLSQDCGSHTKRVSSRYSTFFRGVPESGKAEGERRKQRKAEGERRKAKAAEGGRRKAKASGRRRRKAKIGRVRRGGNRDGGGRVWSVYGLG